MYRNIWGSGEKEEVVGYVFQTDSRERSGCLSCFVGCRSEGGMRWGVENMA